MKYVRPHKVIIYRLCNDIVNHLKIVISKCCQKNKRIHESAMTSTGRLFIHCWTKSITL